MQFNTRSGFLSCIQKKKKKIQVLTQIENLRKAKVPVLVYWII